MSLKTNCFEIEPPYNRIVKCGKWYEWRLAEPKDYNYATHEYRSLLRSTYNRLGTLYNKIPITTYQSMLEDNRRRSDYIPRFAKPMVTLDSLGKTNFERDLKRPKRGPGALLPRHPPGYHRHDMETTHKAEYLPPYPYAPADFREDIPDHSAAYKRGISQFTGRGDYRRPGWNTWVDESGIYHNTHLHRQIHMPTQCITGNKCDEHMEDF